MRAYRPHDPEHDCGGWGGRVESAAAELCVFVLQWSWHNRGIHVVVSSVLGRTASRAGSCDRTERTLPPTPTNQKNLPRQMLLDALPSKPTALAKVFAFNIDLKEEFKA